MEEEKLEIVRPMEEPLMKNIVPEEINDLDSFSSPDSHDNEKPDSLRFRSSMLRSTRFLAEFTNSSVKHVLGYGDRGASSTYDSCVSETEIKRAQKVEREASELRGTKRKRMEFPDYD